LFRGKKSNGKSADINISVRFFINEIATAHAHTQCYAMGFAMTLRAFAQNKKATKKIAWLLKRTRSNIIMLLLV
jgi:hypothetical protein